MKKSKTKCKPSKFTKRKSIKGRKNPNTSIGIPSNKEDAFKLGFLSGLRDGYENFRHFQTRVFKLVNG